jgi:hypothetical protein
MSKVIGNMTDDDIIKYRLRHKDNIIAGLRRENHRVKRLAYYAKRRHGNGALLPASEILKGHVENGN